MPLSRARNRLGDLRMYQISTSIIVLPYGTVWTTENCPHGSPDESLPSKTRVVRPRWSAIALEVIILLPMGSGPIDELVVIRDHYAKWHLSLQLHIYCTHFSTTSTPTHTYNHNCRLIIGNDHVFKDFIHWLKQVVWLATEACWSIRETFTLAEYFGTHGKP